MSNSTSCRVDRIAVSVFYAAFALMPIACGSSSKGTDQEAPAADESALISKTAAQEPKKTTIMVVGDIQLRGKLLHPKLAKETLTIGAWKKDRLHTKEIEALEPARLFEDIAPDLILQTGDFVEYSTSTYDPEESRLSLKVGDRKYAAPYDEWEKTQAFLPDNVDIFPVMGNHEYYIGKTYTAVPVEEGSKDATSANLDEMKVRIVGQDNGHRKPEDMRGLLLNKFPHLDGKVEFHQGDGKPGSSYFYEHDSFCLLSLDGIWLLHDDNDGRELSMKNRSLLDFIEAKLVSCTGSSNVGASGSRKPVIVICHYPIFSVEPLGQQDLSDLVRHKLVALFNEHKAALIIGAHEHVYMRYLEPGLRKASYEDFLPLESVYLSVANFGNPWTGYSRWKIRGSDKLKKEELRLSFGEDNRVLGNKRDFFYHEDSHYAVIDISKSKIEVMAKGFFSEDGHWEIIDQFTMEQKSEGSWEVKNNL